MSAGGEKCATSCGRRRSGGERSGGGRDRRGIGEREGMSVRAGGRDLGIARSGWEGRGATTGGLNGVVHGVDLV